MLLESVVNENYVNLGVYA